MTTRHRQVWCACIPGNLNKQIRANARALFEQIVAQARLPVFYESLSVPDTVEGRFEIITLHMFVILRRLREDAANIDAVPVSSALATQNYAVFAQYVFDAMFDNMDDNLRELGVGDLSVGKKIRALGEAFYGRIGAYEAAFEATDPDQALRAAIGRNILRLEDAEADPEAAGQESSRAILADYILRANEGLMRRSRARLRMGIGYFPQIRYDTSFRS